MGYKGTGGYTMKILKYIPFVKVVTVYDVVRQYGGPEEGGWWYDSYDMVYYKITLTPKRTFQKLREEYAEEHTGKNKVLSVDPIPDDYDPIDPNDETGIHYGKDIVIKIESLGEYGELETKERPHYE